MFLSVNLEVSVLLSLLGNKFTGSLVGNCAKTKLKLVFKNKH